MYAKRMHRKLLFTLIALLMSVPAHAEESVDAVSTEPVDAVSAPSTAVIDFGAGYVWFRNDGAPSIQLLWRQQWGKHGFEVGPMLGEHLLIGELFLERILTATLTAAYRYHLFEHERARLGLKAGVSAIYWEAGSIFSRKKRGDVGLPLGMALDVHLGGGWQLGASGSWAYTTETPMAYAHLNLGYRLQD